MEKVIRWGIVGPGVIANKFAEAIKNVEGAKLVAVASRTEGKGQEFAKKHGIENVFGEYEKMAENDIIDAVYIATPHTFHKSCAEIFLNAKKHVLCEKPVCVNQKDAQSLMECAAKNNVFLMEAMWTRFLPAVLKAIEIANSGEIGEIRGVSADFCYSITYDEDRKIFRSDMAGGGLLDVGVYGLNFAAMVLGYDIEDICALSDVRDGIDCQTSVLIKYKSGAVASISGGVNVLKPTNGYIYGTKGYITLPKFYGADELIVTIGDDQKKIVKPYMGNGFEEEICEACSCIRAGKIQSDIMPMEESIRIIKQMDLIREKINLKYPFE